MKQQYCHAMKCFSFRNDNVVNCNTVGAMTFRFFLHFLSSAAVKKPVSILVLLLSTVSRHIKLVTLYQLAREGTSFQRTQRAQCIIF